MVKNLSLALGLVVLVSLGGFLFLHRVPRYRYLEIARVPRTGTDEYAVSYGAMPPELRDRWPFVITRPVHWRYKVCLEAPKERASNSSGPVVWESVDVVPDSMTWLTRDSLRVDVPHIIYPPRYRESVRVHRHRGVVVTTVGLTAVTEATNP